MSVQLTLKSHTAQPLSRTPARVRIEWEFCERNIPGSVLQDHQVFILRAEAQDAIPGFQHIDMMTQKESRVQPIPASTHAENVTAYISQPISALDYPWYIDQAVNLQMLNRPVYYKLVIQRISTQETTESELFTFEGELDLIGLYIVEEHNFLLEDTIGVPSLIYQRRRGGIRCPKCFDELQSKRTLSKCNSCFGTNWVGGFYRAIDSYVDYSPNPKTVDITPWGEMQPNESQVLLSNFPEVTQGDLVKEIRSGRLWRFEKIQPTEKRRVPMLQFCRVSEVKPGDIEYHLPFDAKYAAVKLKELEAIKRKREF